MDKKKKLKEKFYQLYDLANIKNKKFLEKQELYNLYKKPKKDKGDNMPHIHSNEINTVQQADILYLPNDNGYKYCLVVVDIGSRLTDAVPLKNKSAEDVKKAFEEIYERGILKMPSYSMQTDPGSEFKGVVKKYFEDNDVYVRYGKPGRHRQQGLVEARNRIIGNILLKRMQAQELLTNQKATSWVKHLPLVIKAMNNYYPEAYLETKNKIPDEPLCEGDSCTAFEIGTKVRVILDEPKDTQGNKLPGRFRSADIRFDPKIRTIKNVLVNPGEPILYLLDGHAMKGGIDNVAYTKNQLQKVNEDEEDVPGEIVFDKESIDNPNTTWVPKKILDKKKIKNKWMLKISWKGFDSKHDTWEPQSEIKKFYPDMVNDFENDE